MGCGPQISRRNAIVACFGMAIMSFYSFAQCPAGFVDLGEISATTSPGRYKEVNTTREIALPDGIQLDNTYHQKSIQAASDGGASNLRAIQIPAGLHLIPGGLSSGGWWSIDNPRLIEEVAIGSAPVHSIFRIDLYANTGGRSLPIPPRNGAFLLPSVWVRVCMKRRT
jgi:hypothetical protein